MAEEYPGLKDMKKKTDGAKSGSNVTLQLAVSALAHSLHNSTFLPNQYQQANDPLGGEAPS